MSIHVLAVTLVLALGAGVLAAPKPLPSSATVTSARAERVVIGGR